MERKIYRDRNFQGLTQGSIISGLEIERFSNYPVWGIVITPRCDLARGISVETVHVLPVVDLKAWFEVEGKYLLVNKYRGKLKDKINKKLPKDFIDGDVFESGFTNKELKELIADLADLPDKHNLIDWLEKLDKKDDDLISESQNKDSITSMIDNLSSDKEKRFYLVEDWEHPRSTKVILLREILRINRELALKYKDGFTEKEYDKELLKSYNLKTTEDQNQTYEIVKELLSPYIEHVMQRFAYNFTRIGVVDRSFTTIKLIKEKLINSDHG